jgi:hypothetical protein
MFLRATSFDHAAAEKMRNKAPRITMLRTITATVVGAAPHFTGSIGAVPYDVAVSLYVAALGIGIG